MALSGKWVKDPKQRAIIAESAINTVNNLNLPANTRNTIKLGILSAQSDNLATMLKDKDFVNSNKDAVTRYLDVFY